MSAEKGLFKLLFQTCQHLCRTLIKLKELDSCLRTAQVGDKQGTTYCIQYSGGQCLSRLLF